MMSIYIGTSQQVGIIVVKKDKGVPLQAWSGPEGG